MTEAYEISHEVEKVDWESYFFLSPIILELWGAPSDVDGHNI